MKTEALKLALGYVERNCPALVFEEIKEALAQPEQEPLTDEAKAVIDAARAAMDESVEAYDSDGSIKISSHLAACLSSCLDEYDSTIEAAHGITKETK